MTFPEFFEILKTVYDSPPVQFEVTPDAVQFREQYSAPSYVQASSLEEAAFVLLRAKHDVLSKEIAVVNERIFDDHSKRDVLLREKRSLEQRIDALNTQSEKANGPT